MMINKNISAKITSLILCVVLIFSAMSCTAGEAVDNVNMMLTAENFVLSGVASTIDTSGITGKLFQNSIKVQKLDPVTAEFYIEEAGVYSMWFLTGSASTDTLRYPVVTVDGVTEDLAFSNEFTWKKMTSAFASGWHTVSLTTSDTWRPYFMNAIYVTNNASLELTTDNDDSYISYVDNTAPAFAEDAQISTAFADDECTVTFPQATDDSKVIYEYKIGDNTTSISDITSGVNVGSITEETTITLVATDVFSNTSNKSFTVTPLQSGNSGENPQPPSGGEPSTQYEELMLTAENFTLSGTYSAIVTDGLTNKLFQKVIKVQRFDAVIAKFYIETAGTYSLQFLTGSASTDTGRYPVANIDGTVENLAHSNEMTWKSISKELSAGWHTVSFTTSGEWLPYFINALFITNDESNELTVDNDNDKYGAYVPDITAPVIGDSDIVTSFEGNICTATFPAATGDTDEKIIYEYTIGDTTTLISDITSPVNIGAISTETTVTLTASDIFGNSASKSYTVTPTGSSGGENPPAGGDPVEQDKPMMLTAENFALSGTYSAIVTDGLTNKLFNNSVKVQRFDAVTAKFYIETSGIYFLQFLTGSASADTGRYPVVTVDDNESVNLAHSQNMIWEKITCTFDAGWHTVSLTTSGEWLPYFFNALFITDDESIELTVDNDNDKFGTYVPDTTAPVIGNSDIVTSFEGNICTATFPAATGDTGEKIIYEYTVGGNTTLISDIVSPVNVGALSGETTITLTASDIFGNSASKTYTVIAPESGDGEAPGGDEPPAGGDTQKILLSGENFNIPDYGSGNGLSANGGTATGNLFANSVKIAGADASIYITAQVYIAKAGTYNLWVLSANELAETNVSFTSRLAMAGFDGEFQNCTPHMVHQWEKSQWELTEGWHTVNVGMKNSWGNVKVNAVYITDDLEFVLDTSSDDSLISYHDTTAPSYASQDVTVTYTDASNCTLTFPVCTDDKAIVKTVYYVNGNPVETEDGSITLTGLKPLEKVTLISEAIDMVGNKGVLNCEYLSSPVKVSGFSVKKGTDILADSSSLSAGDIVSVNTDFSNRTSGLKDVEMSLCVYSANYERMLMCIPTQITLTANATDMPANVSLTLPTGFDSTCIIAATVWDKTTGEPYIAGIEIKGAAQ